LQTHIVGIETFCANNGFWRFANNGEKGVFGLEAECFWLEQFVGDCSAIVRIVRDCSGANLG
jgi:hypothetical protein